MPRATALFLCMSVAGCGHGKPAPHEPAADTAAVEPTAEPSPAPAAPTSSPTTAPVAPTVAPSPTPAAAAAIRATASMPLDGNVDTKALVDSINAQVAPLAACVALIRKTDTVVGSLNVRLTIAADGAVTTELQSPVNTEAERCLRDGMRPWKTAAGKPGHAMLLLGIEEAR